MLLVRVSQAVLTTVVPDCKHDLVQLRSTGLSRVLVPGPMYTHQKKDDWNTIKRLGRACSATMHTTNTLRYYPSSITMLHARRTAPHIAVRRYPLSRRPGLRRGVYAVIVIFCSIFFPLLPLTFLTADPRASMFCLFFYSPL